MPAVDLADIGICMEAHRLFDIVANNKRGAFFCAQTLQRIRRPRSSSMSKAESSNMELDTST